MKQGFEGHLRNGLEPHNLCHVRADHALEKGRSRLTSFLRLSQRRVLFLRQRLAVQVVRALGAERAVYFHAERGRLQ